MNDSVCTMIETVNEEKECRHDSGIAMVPSVYRDVMDNLYEAHSSCPDPQPMILEEAIVMRHSPRLFLPKEVPKRVLDRAVDLASHSPSNSNTQPWRLFIVRGAALNRLKAALMEEASSGEGPNIPALPQSFRHYRSELGKTIYGQGWRIPHDDVEARRRAVMRNFEFFGAPVGCILCISNELPGRAAFDVGLYCQTLMLALTAQGVGSCAEISIAGYPELVRREVGIPKSLEIICGLALGYEDLDAGVNKVRSGREKVDKTTVWVN